MLREATASDLEDLVDLEVLSQTSPWSVGVFAKELTLEYSTIWVFEWESEVCAYMVFWLIADEIHLLNLVVSSDHRRRGLASRMVSELQTFGKKQGASVISLEVRVGNEAAIQLYQDAGFKQIGHRANYYRDNGEDAYVLACILESDAPVIGS